MVTMVIKGSCKYSSMVCACSSTWATLWTWKLSYMHGNNTSHNHHPFFIFLWRSSCCVI